MVFKDHCDTAVEMTFVEAYKIKSILRTGLGICWHGTLQRDELSRGQLNQAVRQPRNIVNP
jgi:hypothetical protein